MSEDRFATALTVTIDDNTAMRAFFKKFSRDEAAIKANLYHELPQIISQRPHKIKAAWGLKHQGQTILEYKIVLKPRSFRAAYIQCQQQISVIFISDILIKREFVNALAATHLVD
ncbi:hypothetical protein [Edwardsiella tarda]|uniref:hypothetical protein n=1 Tax=Edwardsiella tarda TaxID=636 RepID=UPI00098F2A59|nr:hypothetical protein [Edwardsiella tarda]